MPDLSQDPNNLRIRRALRPAHDPDGPRVPPKSTGISRTSKPQPLSVKRYKALPPAPSPKLSAAHLKAKKLPPKPLPDPPQTQIQTINLNRTIVWVIGFCVWFLLIVVLLPVITEKDAMPGVNGFLKRWLCRGVGVACGAWGGNGR